MALLVLAANASFAAEPRRLTDDGRYKQDLTFTPDGKHLVYVVQETPEQTSIMRLSLEPGKAGAGKPERLHPKATTAEFEPAFSRDGRYLAFVQSRGNLSLKLVIRDTRTEKDAVFDPGGGFFGMHVPAITPDAKRVIFSIPDETGQQLASVDLEGKNRRELTTGTAVNNWPDISPDGKQIALGSSRDGDFEIYTMNVDGSGLRRLTHSPGRDVRPKWSPDGRRIAFASVRDGNYEIYVMRADGSGQRNVSKHAERDDYPAWHPDGKRLAIVSERSGRFDVYLMEAGAIE